MVMLPLYSRHPDLDELTRAVFCNSRFQAWQSRVVYWRSFIWLAIFGEEATVTGAMVLPVRVLPFHDAAHMCTGCRNRDYSGFFSIISIAMDEVAYNGVSRKANCLISKVSQLHHRGPAPCAIRYKRCRPCLCA